MADLLHQPLPPRPVLTAEQRELIKGSAPILAPDKFGTQITSRFYRKMLEIHDDLNDVFSYSKQATGKQALALASSVYAYAENINDLTPILAVVERVCQRHASLNITPGMYNIVGTYLLEAIELVLGENGIAFVDPLKQAWVDGYWALAYIFIDREAQLYKAAGWEGWKDFVVAKRVKESSDITSFYLKPVDGKPLPSFKPGWYISVRLLIPELGHKQPRQYSLSDTPSPDHYRISVKREPGTKITTESGAVDHPAFISNLMHDKVQEGSIIEVAYPFGEFYLDETDSPVVLISAGVGLTPVLSMLNTLTLSTANGIDGGTVPVPVRPRRPISWIQGVRNPNDHPFLKHVQELARAHPEQIKTGMFYSGLASDGIAQLREERKAEGGNTVYAGRMKLAGNDELDQSLLCLDNKGTQYYMCGPTLFMDGITEELKSLGVDEARIHSEVFVA